VRVARKLDNRRAEHAAILQACIDHDADRAARSLHNHLTTTANVVSQAMGGEAVFEPMS
jgi:DNA-binding GntR family transcriptional regulator